MALDTQLPVVAGDEAVDTPFDLEQLALRCYAKLLSLLRSRGSSSEDAADLVQGAFERLSATKERVIRHPEAYLFRTALNLQKDIGRSRALQERRHTVPLPDEGLICRQPDPEVIASDREQIQLLKNLLQDMPPKMRAIFVLYHFDEIPQREIADRLGYSVSMIEKQIRRATRMIEARLTVANQVTEGGRKPSQ